MRDGFYKYTTANGLQYAPNFVSAPTFELLRSLKDTYTYPINGWYWFDTYAEASTFWNLNEGGEPAPQYVEQSWTPFEFYKRFTDEEQTMLFELAGGDVGIRKFLFLLSIAESVSNTNPQIISVMKYLVQLGAMSKNRAKEIIGS